MASPGDLGPGDGHGPYLLICAIDLVTEEHNSSLAAHFETICSSVAIPDHTLVSPIPSTTEAHTFLTVEGDDAKVKVGTSKAG